MLPFIGHTQLAFLQRELFDKQEPLIFKIDTSELRCNDLQFDKVILEDTIKYTVDVDTIVAILKKITYLELTVDSDSLKNLYARYAEHYNESWGDIYRNYCLAEKDGAAARTQFNVLTAFETTLRSLSLSDKTPAVIWESVMNDYTIIQKLLAGDRTTQLFEDGYTYSSIFKKLRSKPSWYGSYIEFTYLDPYASRIKDYFIEELTAINCPIDSTDTVRLRFLYQHTRYIAMIDDLRIPEALIKNMRCIDKDPGYFWVHIRYLEKIHHPELLSLAIEKLFAAEHAGHITYKLSHLARNEDNLPILKQSLIEAILTGSKTALDFSRHFPDKETLSALRKARKNPANTKELLELIDRAITHLDYH